MKRPSNKQSTNLTRPPRSTTPAKFLTKAQQAAQYSWTGRNLNGKPEIITPAKGVLSFESAFVHKGLCDGLTFNLALSCGFDCTYCYVGTQLSLHPVINRIRKDTGRPIQDFCLMKQDPLKVLQQELLNARGTPRYADPDDRRVIFTSTLVDPCANTAILDTTTEACRLVLQHTQWQIRVLSKSPLMTELAGRLADSRHRMIYGLSTGTLDGRLAASFEKRVPAVGRRLEALRWLQAKGFRTFAMLCPILPQPNPGAFAQDAAGAIDFAKCEAVWAEILNVRGASLTRTVAALKKAGFKKEAAAVACVRTDTDAMEKYARGTFLALARVVPAGKLRFMQYVQEDHVEWWRTQEANGAISLGKFAG